jgi:hypothetical protein
MSDPTEKHPFLPRHPITNTPYVDLNTLTIEQCTQLIGRSGGKLLRPALKRVGFKISKGRILIAPTCRPDCSDTLAKQLAFAFIMGRDHNKPKETKS